MTSVKLPRPLENYTRSVRASCARRTHEDFHGGETVCDLRGPRAAQSFEQTCSGGDGAGAYQDLLTCLVFFGTCRRLGLSISRPRRETAEVNSGL
ncbi:unnamed protein product [Euphydryas editha]|uniref:Uncharacterized protein n=1 Tax=Euphydryas editha TaxID=104508 RepID=A0AAU9UTM5_EUPED|nr:unnamed protein product [Euphydryas editha]